MDNGQKDDLETKSSNPVEKSKKRGILPGFLGGEGGGERPSGLKDEKSKAAVDDLKSAEKAASRNEPKKSEDNLAGARQQEEEAGGYYSGGGRGDDEKKKGGVKGVLGRKGPILAIVLSIFGVGGLMGGAQFFQPFSFVAQIQETFNSMHISANKRSETFFRYQMSTGRTKSPYNAFGSDFNISAKQQAKLKQQGIDYVEEGGVKKLRFTGSDGKVVDVTADNFKTEYKNNSDFFTRYNAGSMTWRGQIANWFGTSTARFFRNNRLTRNLFKNFDEKVGAEGGNARRAAIDLMEKQAGETGGSDAKRVGVNVDKDEEEKLKITRDDSRSNSKISRSDLKNSADARRIVRAKVDEISSTFKTAHSVSGGGLIATNVICTVVDFIATINLMVQAEQALQIITLSTSYFEAFDKTKAGDGAEAPINELANILNERKTGTYEIPNGTENPDKITTEPKSAMEANAVAALYSGGKSKVNPNDPSVQSFNFSKNTNALLKSVGGSMEAFKGCALTRIVSAGVSVAVDLIEVGTCLAGIAGSIATVGVSLSACAPLLGNVFKSAASGAALATAISQVAKLVVPIITSMFVRDLITDIGGEDLGNALVSGANMYLGNSHRYNGGSLSTLNKYTEFAVAQQQVIADNARYERESLSPFDLTSKYTFMGTLMTNMMGFLTTNSLMGIINNSGRVISSSLISLNTPAVYAYNIVDTLPDPEEYEKTCPYLASIGAVGDAFCNPYAITDVTTIEVDPLDDVIDRLVESGDLLSEPSNNNAQIDWNSDLAKYILFCNERSSGFGVTDQNIANEVKKFADIRSERISESTRNALNGVIGAIPVVGDIVDIAQNQQALDNAGYVNGEACVAGNSLSNAKDVGGSPNWDTAKYYQRFVEDQSLAESMGVIEKSAVTAFLDDYYEKNPLDNSYEGMLARYSGLDKETVVAILDLIEYENYIANYDPSERYAFGEPEVEVEKELRFDNDNGIASVYVILLNQISYADVRNRTFAV
ncbi:hypothetical protein IJJ05_03125 [Candidatus Saccharibacteria bacterium]|nr:hypothetical protein [Candidatus Saccharibacteria bacterium]